MNSASSFQVRGEIHRFLALWRDFLGPDAVFWSKTGFSIKFLPNISLCFPPEQPQLNHAAWFEGVGERVDWGELVFETETSK